MAEQGPDEIAFRTSPSPDRDRPDSSPSDPSELSSAVSPKCASYSVDLNRLLGALTSEHRAWHVRPLDIWTINIPEPLHVSKPPLGLVMAVAPGPPLNICLEGECWNVPLLISAARAIVTAMKKVWLSAELQGDLIFQNICDVDRRSISFVDAGVMPDCHFAGPGTRWHTAVHDLAHILADVSTALRDALLPDHGSADEQQILLDQLYECTRLRVQAKAPDWPSLGLAHDRSNTDEYENTTKWMSSLNVC